MRISTLSIGRLYLVVLLSAACITSSLWGEGGGVPSDPPLTDLGQQADVGASSATALSMVAWGVGSALVIAALATLIHQSAGHAHSDTTSTS